MLFSMSQRSLLNDASIAVAVVIHSAPVLCSSAVAFACTCILIRLWFCGAVAMQCSVSLLTMYTGVLHDLGCYCDCLLQTLTILMNHYPMRLGYVRIVNAGKAMAFFWKVHY
jgi:CRAL/TRIO domain